MPQKSVLLILTGSIAACKALDIIRRLNTKNIRVTCVLTKAAEAFVTPLACSALSGTKTYQSLFSAEDEVQMGHIQLSRQADLVLIAPATADILAKMAHGVCDDLASTLLLATNKPVWVAPAMNVKMWEHAATQRNVAQLQQDGIRFLGPIEGQMACGEWGEGRMMEPEAIEREIEAFFASNTKPLAGRKVLVTSGGTQEAIDPVRFITNRSSGKQGHAIAEELARLGAEVTLVSAPTSLPPLANVETIAVKTAEEMLNACLKTLPVDIAICAAAVSDWKVKAPSKQKLKKQLHNAAINLELIPNPDILHILSHHAKRPKLVIGFAAETENLEKNARQKLKRKGCEWLLANDVSGEKIFGTDTTEILFLTKDTTTRWKAVTKHQAAAILGVHIGDYFAATSNQSNTKKRIVK